MNEEQIAIDLGTSRIKVGWTNEDGKVHILNWNGSAFLPTVFHLPSGESDILVGSEALERAQKDPQGLVDNFKRSVIETGEREQVSKDRQDSDAQLIATMFETIRIACEQQIPWFKSHLPERITVTMPSRAPLVWQDLLRHGASHIGINEVLPEEEPVAAARGWLQTDEDVDVLVIDCGGGTTDWALVAKRPSGYRPLHPGSENLGGSDVDKQLYMHLQRRQSDVVHGIAPQAMLFALKQFKDQVLAGELPDPPVVSDRVVPVDVDTVRAVYQQHFVEPLLQAVAGVLKTCEAANSATQVLLVGGAASSMLCDAFREETTLPVTLHPEPGLAVLYGALSGPALRVGRATKEEQSSRRDAMLEAPMLHGWAINEVRAWQERFAGQRELPIRHQVYLGDDVFGPALVLIPTGAFVMGSPSSELWRWNDERQHEVTIRQPFYLGSCTVTFADYDRFCEQTRRDKPDDAGWGRELRPVINISREDAWAYCDWLSELSGKCYRLPYEAEWEYAARAGLTTPFSTGEQLLSRQANINGLQPYNDAPVGEFRQQSIAVGQFDPNPWGLHDMHGNVWEWIESPYTPRAEASAMVSARETGFGVASRQSVLRGGAWDTDPTNCRLAYRYEVDRAFSGANTGFRICLELSV